MNMYVQYFQYIITFNSLTVQASTTDCTPIFTDETNSGRLIKWNSIAEV